MVIRVIIGNPIRNLAISFTQLLKAMKAFQFETVAAGLERRDVPVPEPGHEQVLIAVKAASLCHSDIHVLNGGGEAWMRAQSLTLGYEVAGTVVKLGPGTSAFPFKTGDRVTVALLGQPVIDRDFKEAIGVGYDGGYAEFAVAYCKQLVKIPAGVSFAQAAVATDSVATAYHAVMCEAKVTKSTRAAVIGLGGLGLVSTIQSSPTCFVPLLLHQSSPTPAMTMSILLTLKSRHPERCCYRSDPRG